MMELKFIKSFLITLVVVPILIGVIQLFSQEEEVEDKITYVSIPGSIKDHRKKEFLFLDGEKKEELISATYNISDSKNQLIYFDFYLQGPEEIQVDYRKVNKEALFIETDSIYLQAKNTKITQINHETGKVSGEATLYVTNYAVSEQEQFKLSLKSSQDDILSRESGIIVAKMVVEDSKEDKTKSSSNFQQQREPQKPVLPKKEQESLEEFQVTEENIDDWDHILDDYELEDYYLEYGLE